MAKFSKAGVGAADCKPTVAWWVTYEDDDIGQPVLIPDDVFRKKFSPIDEEASELLSKVRPQAATPKRQPLAAGPPMTTLPEKKPKKPLSQDVLDTLEGDDIP